MKTFAFLTVKPLCEDYKKTGITAISCGRYNGYVGIIDGDSLSLDNRVLVHGGITFDGKFCDAEDIIRSAVNSNTYRIYVNSTRRDLWKRKSSLKTVLCPSTIAQMA